jgi:osmotically-inducible protein OsmY
VFELNAQALREVSPSAQTVRTPLPQVVEHRGGMDDAVPWRMTNKSDATLQRDVMRELAWDTRIDETAIGVTAALGVVTLTGTVSCWADKHAVEEAAHRVADVLDVANEIEIKQTWDTSKSDTDIARAVRSALEWSRQVRDREIRSTVADHGEVTLAGSVRTLAERDEVERVVRNVDGVRWITNGIVVETPVVAPSVLHAAIESALDRHIAREAHRISIDVEGDTVRLGGTVGSWSERRAVVGVAKGTLGVKHVDDRLRIG